MTVRPVGARIVSYVAGGCLVAMFVAVWVSLSPEIRAVFTPFQVATLLATLGGMLAILWGIARSKVRVDDTGIHVLNGYRRHHVVWDDAVDVALPQGAPWGTLTTEAGGTVMLFAIQGSDGKHARDAIWSIREQILEHRS